MNPHYNSLSSKIQHATQELVKVVTGESKDKLLASDKFTYSDLKRIIERTISNNKLSNDIFVNNVGIGPFFQPHTQTSHMHFAP